MKNPAKFIKKTMARIETRIMAVLISGVCLLTGIGCQSKNVNYILPPTDTDTINAILRSMDSTEPTVDQNI